MPLDDEVGAAGDGGQELRRQARVDLHHTLALDARDVVVMGRSAEAVPVTPVGEGYAIQ
jgi:hypothetical protein